jgi:hypothetical protein
MAETTSGLLDTSVVIDLDVIAPDDLPDEASVSAVTWPSCPRAHTPPTTPPNGRDADLLIAATALAAGMPLYTRNAGDFAGLEQILTVVSV